MEWSAIESTQLYSGHSLEGGLVTGPGPCPPSRFRLPAYLWSLACRFPLATAALGRHSNYRFRGLTRSTKPHGGARRTAASNLEYMAQLQQGRRWPTMARSRPGLMSIGVVELLKMISTMWCSQMCRYQNWTAFGKTQKIRAREVATGAQILIIAMTATRNAA